MNEIDNFKMAGEITSIIDDMSNKIKDLREQYDAAQASSNSRSLISDKERVNRPELRMMNDNLNKKITEFLKEFDK